MDFSQLLLLLFCHRNNIQSNCICQSSKLMTVEAGKPYFSQIFTIVPSKSNTQFIFGFYNLRLSSSVGTNVIGSHFNDFYKRHFLHTSISIITPKVLPKVGNSSVPVSTVVNTRVVPYIM